MGISLDVGNRQLRTPLEEHEPHARLIQSGELASDNKAQCNQGLDGVNVARVQRKSTFLPGECLDRLDNQPVVRLTSNSDSDVRLRRQGSAEAIVPRVFFREGLNIETPKA
jgi:hypothetical protein